MLLSYRCQVNGEPRSVIKEYTFLQKGESSFDFNPHNLVF